MPRDDIHHEIPPRSTPWTKAMLNDIERRKFILALSSKEKKRKKKKQLESDTNLIFGAFIVTQWNRYLERVNYGIYF